MQKCGFVDEGAVTRTLANVEGLISTSASVMSLQYFAVTYEMRQCIYIYNIYLQYFGCNLLYLFPSLNLLVHTDLDSLKCELFGVRFTLSGNWDQLGSSDWSDGDGVHNFGEPRLICGVCVFKRDENG